MAKQKKPWREFVATLTEQQKDNILHAILSRQIDELGCDGGNGRMAHRFRSGTFSARKIAERPRLELIWVECASCPTRTIKRRFANARFRLNPSRKIGNLREAFWGNNKDC